MGHISKGMHFDYYQDITDLAEGVYELSAACFNSSNGVVGDFVNGNVGLYAQADGVEYFSPIIEDAEFSKDKRQVISRIVVRKGNMRIGIKNIGAMTARWAGGDEFKLKYLGSISDIITEGFVTFKANMIEESNQRYKKLFVWNSEQTIADATGIIINPDCFRKDTYGWEVAQVDIATGESHDGIKTNPYWNKWMSSAYTSEMFQDFDYLPEGTYTFSTMLRASTGANVQFFASKDKGVSREFTINFTGTGLNSPAGTSYQNGWDLVSLPKISINKGNSLRLGLSASLTNQWWGADDFKLTYESPQSSGLNDKYKNHVVVTTIGHGLVSFVTDIPADVNIYNVLGNLVHKQTINTGNTTISLPSGMYIINRQKYLCNKVRHLALILFIYSVGLSLKYSLKHLVKYEGDEKPVSYAISEMVLSVCSINCSAAFSRIIRISSLGA